MACRTCCHVDFCHFCCWGSNVVDNVALRGKRVSLCLANAAKDHWRSVDDDAGQCEAQPVNMTGRIIHHDLWIKGLEARYPKMPLHQYLERHRRRVRGSTSGNPLSSALPSYCPVLRRQRLSRKLSKKKTNDIASLFDWDALRSFIDIVKDWK